MARGRAKRMVKLNMRFTHFQLPPIRDALIIGKKAPVGPNSVARAFQAMVPGVYRLIHVEHPTIEAVLVRESDLRKVPQKILVPYLLQQAEAIMDETDALHVSLNIEIIVEGTEFELP